jgi:hypothetical protein
VSSAPELNLTFEAECYIAAAAVLEVDAVLNMGRKFLVVAVVLCTATVLASPARAKGPHSARTYSDGVSGIETYATSTEGRFSGVATGDLPGVWQAGVAHDPLSGTNSSAAITGGSFSVATVLDRSPVNVSGSIADGTVVVQESGLGCLNQQFEVNGRLGSVGINGGPRNGTGVLAVTLTHYRTRVFGFCVTYSASVVGTVSMTF